MSRPRSCARTALRSGAAAVLVVLGATAVVAAVFLFDHGMSEAPADATPVPTLLRAVTLRAAADDGSRAVAELPAGSAVVLRGRSADGRWLVLEPAGRFDVIGWAPADAVANAGDTGALTLFAGSTRPGATATPADAGAPTRTPDHPDLQVEALLSRENRLVVVIVNAGDADATGAIFVSVAGGDRVRVDVGGKPLRPGDRLQATLSNEYVQRRASVAVEISLEADVREEDTTNNRFTAVVEPDRPNDLELLSAELAGADRRLAVTVRNNSMIPLVGTMTLAVRSTQPSLLLSSRLVALNLAPLGTQRYDVPDVQAVDLTRIQVILASDAINDAVAANNVWPR
ncbi:MAG: hypothetical protein EXR65_02015 [Dehalococcoidia bacterium]|nr:hypothetical protein [Dehalococcoidia bacterium]